MTIQIDYEDWLIETGHVIVQKRSAAPSSLTKWESLVYCLWVADYGMRNAGDLDAAADLAPFFQTDGVRLSNDLSLPLTASAFSLDKAELEQEYFDLFDRICSEVVECAR